MEDQRINVVQAPNMPSWILFNNPSDREIVESILLEKVTNGSSSRFNGIIPEIDILLHQPWDLPGMDFKKNVGYYFWERKRKTERAKKIDRVIKIAENSHWHEGEKEKIWDDGDTPWAEKRSFRHQNNGTNTGWLMKEYALAPSRTNNSDRFVLCKIYKKKEKNQQHGHCRGSSSKKLAENGPLQQSSKRKSINAGSSDDCIPQPKQKTQNAAASSPSLVVPYIISGTYSGHATPSTVNFGQLQPPTASFSIDPNIDPAVAVAPCPMPCQSLCIAPLSGQTTTALCSIEVHRQETHPTAAESWTMAVSSTFAQVNPTYDAEGPMWEAEEAMWEAADAAMVICFNEMISCSDQAN